MSELTLSRREMIGTLVAHSVRTAQQESPPRWLNEVFENGFVGYGKYSDRQLALEMRLRGLLARGATIVEGENDSENDDDSDDEDRDDDMKLDDFQEEQYLLAQASY